MPAAPGNPAPGHDALVLIVGQVALVLENDPLARRWQIRAKVLAGRQLTVDPAAGGLLTLRGPRDLPDATSEGARGSLAAGSASQGVRSRWFRAFRFTPGSNRASSRPIVSCPALVC